MTRRGVTSKTRQKAPVRVPLTRMASAKLKTAQYLTQTISKIFGGGE